MMFWQLLKMTNKWIHWLLATFLQQKLKWKARIGKIMVISFLNDPTSQNVPSKADINGYTYSKGIFYSNREKGRQQWQQWQTQDLETTTCCLKMEKYCFNSIFVFIWCQKWKGFSILMFQGHKGQKGHTSS